MQVFSSAGDCGDVIYSLLAIQARGGGAVRLFPAPYATARMTSAGLGRLSIRQMM
jgi:hypothetical protein